MSKFLVTPSLLSSYNWYISEFNNKPESRQEWLDRLGKIRNPMSEPAQKGIDFEDKVRKECKRFEDGSLVGYFLMKEDAKDKEKLYNWCSLDIAHKVQGGYWQEKLTKTIEFQGNQYVLYGKSDVIKENTIYDIKTTKKYEVGKFINNPQHAFYCYCAGIPNFKYLVTDFKEVYEESYSNMTQETCLEYIKSYLGKFLAYLEIDSECYDLFKKFWKSKY